VLWAFVVIMAGGVIKNDHYPNLQRWQIERVISSS